jgi:hypothetical protein
MGSDICRPRGMRGRSLGQSARLLAPRAAPGPFVVGAPFTVFPRSIPAAPTRRSTVPGGSSTSAKPGARPPVEASSASLASAVPVAPWRKDEPVPARPALGRHGSVGVRRKSEGPAAFTAGSRAGLREPAARIGRTLGALGPLGTAAPGIGLAARRRTRGDEARRGTASDAGGIDAAGLGSSERQRGSASRARRFVAPEGRGATRANRRRGRTCGGGTGRRTGSILEDGEDQAALPTSSVQDVGGSGGVFHRGSTIGATARHVLSGMYRHQALIRSRAALAGPLNPASCGIRPHPRTSGLGPPRRRSTSGNARSRTSVPRPGRS